MGIIRLPHTETYQKGRVNALGDPVHTNTISRAQGGIALEDALAMPREVMEKPGIGGRLECLRRCGGRGAESRSHEQRGIERRGAV